MPIFYFILFCIAVYWIFFKKKKPKLNAVAVPSYRNAAYAAPVNAAALQLSTKHFGSEWDGFLKAKSIKVFIGIEDIRRLVAICYSKMGAKPLETLLVSFFGLSSNQSGISFSVAFKDNNYTAFHEQIYQLIIAGRFTESNLQAMLSRYVQNIQAEKKKKDNIQIVKSAVDLQKAAVNSVKVEQRQTNNVSEIIDDSIIEVSQEMVPLPQDNGYSSPVELNHEQVYSEYNPEDYLLGKLYKQKLDLKPEQVRWLNKFYNYRNVFTSIEGCEIENVKLYLLTVSALSKRLKKQGSTLAAEILILKNKTAEYNKEAYGAWQGYDYGFNGNSAETDVYYFIYKKAEMLIREAWGHRRKISAEFSSRSAEVKSLFDAGIGALVNELVAEFVPTIARPDEETEISLNEASTTRWRDTFSSIIAKGDSEQLKAELYELGRLNAKNPSVENIYYEASKFLAPFDKLEALKFYLHYIWHDLSSVTVDGKALNKTIQKKLFSTPTQLEEFQILVNDLTRTHDLEAALAQVSNIYKLKRKVIQLDRDEIEKVEAQHGGTVEKLSQYLQDEEEVYELNIPVAPEAAAFSEARSATFVSSDVVSTQVPLGAKQLAFLEVFVLNNYELDFSSVEAFATEHGLFKNQLIDGLNDACYELLDDVLIEESADGYELNANYYKQILS